MKLFILRHGEAERLNSTDRQRQLTDYGREQVRAVVTRNLDDLKFVDSIWVSPYVRARQTAAVVAKSLPEIIQTTVDVLTPDSSAAEVIRFLCARNSDSTLLLVSHQPLVSELIAELCELPRHSISMPTAALASISIDPVGKGCGQLNFID